MHMHRLVFILLTLVFSACGKKNVPKADLWENVTDPAEMFKAYVRALSEDRLDDAMAYLYIPDASKVEFFRSGWAPLARKVQTENWSVSIIALVEKDRFAGMIWTSNSERSDPSSVLAVNDNGKWKLHHHSIAGDLRHIFNKQDFETAVQVVETTKQKLQDIKSKRAELP